MLSMLRRVASEGPTLLLASTSFRSDTISMVPRAILVGTPRAWKKEVLPGSMPVLPAGIQTSEGATAPARAGAATLLARILSRMSFRSALVKTKPTLPLTKGRRRSYSGESGMKDRQRTMVFFPIKTTPCPRRDCLISCIC
ncbi:60S acidic ribosomal protein P0 [Colletotrichum higginsianum]|uniref:60S acidic ribosomal protein P0 n=1 Tax=Colletotrichum higginsianum (strain IMI 349063) TaxID=759273 RepID=H1VMD5_COLHI|nr:60S acidic ribosomal protein P0 [Colletotrichum higginsianum]